MDDTRSSKFESGTWVGQFERDVPLLDPVKSRQAGIAPRLFDGVDVKYDMAVSLPRTLPTKDRRRDEDPRF